MELGEASQMESAVAIRRRLAHPGEGVVNLAQQEVIFCKTDQERRPGTQRGRIQEWPGRRQQRNGNARNGNAFGPARHIAATSIPPVAVSP